MLSQGEKDAEGGDDEGEGCEVSGGGGAGGGEGG